MPPQRRPFHPLSIQGNSRESRASEPASHSYLQFQAAVPVQLNIESLLSPEEQPPPQEPERFLYRYKKKRPDPFLLDQAVFFFLSVRQRTAAEVLPSSPHFYPQHSGRLSPGGTPCHAASPPVKVLGKEGAQGGKSFFKGFLPVSFHRLTSTPPFQPTRREQTIYS